MNLAFWPIAAFVRWHYGASLGWSRADHTWRFAAMLASAALLTLVIGIVTTLALHVDNPWTLDDSLDPTLHLFQYIGIAGAVGTLIALVNALHAWRSPSRGFLGRLKETAVALSCAALTWFAWTMNLFDLSLRY